MADLPPTSLLILIRHGESLWNALHQWTGWTDIGLSQNGKEEARRAAAMLRDIPIHHAFTSKLARAADTLNIILDVLERTDVPITADAAFNERNYGIYTGKNKLEIKQQIGEEAFTELRRGWDYPIPQGESLKDVHARVLPYYEQNILPELKNGKNVLIVAHGNSLRALIKDLDHVADSEISRVELATGEVLMYRVDRSTGEILSKERKAVHNPSGIQ